MSKDLKKMANWLRSGAIMLTDSCPECSSPLFRLNEEIWCLKCNKKVIRAQEGEAPSLVEKSILLKELESTILSKLRELERRLSSEEDPEKIRQLGELTLLLLELLGKTKTYLKSPKR